MGVVVGKRVDGGAGGGGGDSEIRVVDGMLGGSTGRSPRWTAR